MMLMRTAKSCRSDAPMLASSLANFRGTRVQKKPGQRGEREVSRKTIAQGRPGLLRCTCGDYARVLYLFRTRGRGCIGHPAFPAPSVYRGANGSCKPRAHRAARMRRRIWNSTSLRGAQRRYPSLRAQRSNPFRRVKKRMDCFVASLLAMTAAELAV